MRSKTICFAFVLLVVLNAIPFDGNITYSYEYELEAVRPIDISTPSQTEEFNISSYKDFADVAADLLVSHLMNLTDGTVFHASDANWEIYQLLSSLANYYWAISALAKQYESTGNITYSIAMSRAALRMVELFLDPVYPGFYVNSYAEPELATTKRAGVQAYAYWALDLAEGVNASLDFSAEKQSAIRCLTDILYDDLYGGFYFYTMRNGSLNIPGYFFEIYPNSGKRLDHLVLGANALFDAWVETSNATLLDIANHALNFLYHKMPYYFSMDLSGLRLAVLRNGSAVTVEEGLRSGNAVVTDLNAMAIRALLKGYEVTGNVTYLNFVENLFAALLEYNWDKEAGGWFAETLDGIPYDPLDDEDVKYYKYSEIQFQMTLALEDYYELTLTQFPLRMVIDTFELVLTKLWDFIDEGFVRNGNQEWAVLDDSWEIHYTAVQSQAVLALEIVWAYGLPYVSNVRIQPISPRPHDLINFIATAHDADGISMVYVNYTLSINGTETTGILLLPEHPLAGGVYNNTLNELPDQTRCNFFVVANDTTGREFIAGSYFFIVRADIYAPVVTLRAIYPTDEVRIGDEVIIDFEVYEFPQHSFVWNCELWWRVNSGAFTISNMTFMGVDGELLVFRRSLGQFNAGDQLEFEGRIEDEAGNIGVSARHRLTILGPRQAITPLATWQILAAIGLIAAPGVGYVWAKGRKREYSDAQREGKKAAKHRARRRGSRRRR
ncbi:MAG: hypothetical protein AM325_002405 [Candidatus Thorarchaeota archaeon SMTZ1-45]|nr:MAG: hypothetical protein AM325_04205 [Candidatus Thorarchaeota archaeon SMTZ1-45]